MTEPLPRVTVDLDTGELRFNGELFPYRYVGVEPVIGDAPDGTSFPAVAVVIACADVQIIKPSEVLPSDGQD
jgi:hypothetical protein